ncbi:hypothetical protein M378DRAFT_160372 [Amanita muscaria Koide BX008]|uniref:Uncharacterized protein n=1 Tax=Amanita muscaria (strain Koide BX008) TaxID=946122 RepID=A0A0C2TIQ2_AMAMK|nr:hypothetical protein M378DRAFT_160372 [Amanita muscaria Koide BX008]
MLSHSVVCRRIKSELGLSMGLRWVLLALPLLLCILKWIPELDTFMMSPLPDSYSGFLSIFATRNNYDVKLTTRAGMSEWLYHNFTLSKSHI